MPMGRECAQITLCDNVFRQRGKKKCKLSNYSESHMWNMTNNYAHFIVNEKIKCIVNNHPLADSF